jgi:hypothetical protein
MTPFPPHWLWSVYAGLILLVIAIGLVLELTPIIEGHIHQTLSWILWEHWKLPVVLYYGFGFLLIGLIAWAMLLHFPFHIG